MRVGILVLGVLLLSGCAGTWQAADDRQGCAAVAAPQRDAGSPCATVQTATDQAAQWDAEERALRRRFASPLSAF